MKKDVSHTKSDDVAENDVGIESDINAESGVDIENGVADEDDLDAGADVAEGAAAEYGAFEDSVVGDDLPESDADEDEDTASFETDDDYDEDSDLQEADGDEVDLSEAGFPEVTRRFEDPPHKFFADPQTYYKTALSNEGEIAHRVHGLLQKYMGATDPKDRSVFRAQIITAYWEFLRGVAKRTPGNISEPKKFLLRFNLLHPNFVKAETRDFFSQLITENELNQPVYYVDEWFKGVGTGIIRASTSDEIKLAKSGKHMKLQQLLEKANGKLTGFKTLLKGKDQERRFSEQKLIEQINVITEHFPMEEFEDISTSYNDSQKRTFSDLQETVRNLLRVDRELNTFIKEYRQAEADVQTLQNKVDEGGDVETIDLQAIDSEYDTIRQASKMTVGRQGNHFPVLTRDYFHCGPNDVGFRENIISMLGRIESIDAEAFCRYYRNKLNRIAPYVVLIPTYGDTGICWEPFDKHNRATSRGRVFIPMYPKNLYIAVLSAVADLRWQVAKEKASYYWMEEGLTGNYYQWFAAQKLKGDVKEYFIQDYILWMTKEAEGIQKLEKEIRGTFWRYMPFTQEVKEKLKTRSYVYQELYQRDLNRAMSDGY